MLQLLRDWVIVYAANLAGCLLTCYFFAYLTDLFVAPSYLGYVKDLAVAKATTANFGQLLLKGIPANTLVCMYALPFW